MRIKKLNQAGFNYIYLFVGVAVALVLIGITAFVMYTSEQNKKQAQKAAASTVNRNDPFIKKYGDNCVDAPINMFSAAPVATDQVRYIEPLGKTAGTQVLPAVYASIVPLNPNAAANSYNLIMPSNGKIVSIEKNKAGDAYSIVASYNCRYYTVFNNVPTLADAIASKISATMEPGATEAVNISVKAGEPIGSFGNQPVQWIMVDAKTTAKGFISATPYDSQPWIAHAIDPFSVYNPATKIQLQTKSLRSVEPIGGKADYDKAGSLSGNWFKTGTGGFVGVPLDPWVNYLSVAPNFIDPTVTIVSIGNWEGKPSQFAVKGKVDATTATKENSPVKYELMELTYLKPDGSVWNPTTDGFVKGLTVSQNNPIVGTIMFEVQDDNKIRLQRFPGKAADQITVFEASAELYER
jgi:hypothetical protein